MTIICLDLPGF